MLLSFDEIETNHGSVALIATVTGVPGEHAVKPPDAEGEIERKGMSKRHMIEAIAVGAGLGVATGARRRWSPWRRNWCGRWGRSWRPSRLLHRSQSKTG